jgi:ribose transport system substrate-binding protein
VQGTNHVYKLNRLSSLALSASLGLALAACGGSPHTTAERYFLVATNVKLPYWQSAANGLNSAATALRVRADVAGPESFDPKAQQEEFRRILALQPRGILVSPADPDLLKEDIDAAIAKGIPVITIDSDAPDSKRLFFIGTNNYQAGLMGGRLTAQRLGGKGNVVIYTMPEQTNLRERLRGYEDVFAANPQIRITRTIDIHGDPRIAFDQTSEIVAKNLGGVDAFVCLEAIACAEVAEVLGRNNVSGKLVVAMDAEPRTIEWIEKGVIAATIAQKPFTMAYTGLRMLADLNLYKLQALDEPFAREAFSPVPAFVDTGSFVIDKGNLGEYKRERDNAGK